MGQRRRRRRWVLGTWSAACSLQVQLPATANEAPPGFYMLFVLDAAGVPSLARILRLD